MKIIYIVKYPMYDIPYNQLFVKKKFQRTAIKLISNFVCLISPKKKNSVVQIKILGTVKIAIFVVFVNK